MKPGKGSRGGGSPAAAVACAVLSGFLFVPSRLCAQSLPPPQAAQLSQLATQITRELAQLLEEADRKIAQVTAAKDPLQAKESRLRELADKIVKKVGEFDRLVDTRPPLIAKQAGASEADVRKLFQATTKAQGQLLAPTLEARLLATIGNLTAAKKLTPSAQVRSALDAAVAALRRIARFFDTTPPVIAFAEPANNSITNDNTPFIRVTYSDALSGVDLSTFRITENMFVKLTPFATIGPAEATLTVPAEKAFPDGRRFLAAQILDNAGNSAMAESQVLVDTRPPVIVIAGPASGNTIDTLSPLFVIQYTDAVTGIETSGVDAATLTILINGQDRTAQFSVSPVEARFQPAAPVLVEGTNMIAVSVKDRASNQGAASATVTVALPRPVPELHVRLEKVSGDNQVGLTNRCLDNPIVWKAVNADTGEVIEGIPTQAEFASGDGIIVEAPGLATVTNAQGLAGVRVIPGPAAGSLSVRVTATGFPDAAPVTFALASRLPKLDLVAERFGPEFVTIEGNCGRGKTSRMQPSFDGSLRNISTLPPEVRDVRFPGEAARDVWGVRAFDAQGNPASGVEVRPTLIDFAGDPRPMEGVVEFMPSKALTRDDGRAFFAVILSPMVAPGDVLRIRFELPEFDSGDAERTPLGCDWLFAVLAPVAPDGTVQQDVFVAEGQGQIALAGMAAPKPLVALKPVKPPTTEACVSFCTTQPGDRLELVEGTLLFEDLTGGRHTLAACSSTGRVGVVLHLGPVPLPRTVHCSAPGTFFAVGGPEVRVVSEGVNQRLVDVPAIVAADPASVAQAHTFGIELRTPVNHAPSSVTLQSMNACLERKSSIDHGIAPSVLASIPVSLVEQNAQFAVYRSNLDLVATSRLLKPGEIATQPAGFQFVQITDLGRLEVATEFSPDGPRIQVRKGVLEVPRGELIFKERSVAGSALNKFAFRVLGFNERDVVRAVWDFGDGDRRDITRSRPEDKLLTIADKTFDPADIAEHRRKDFNLNVVLTTRDAAGNEKPEAPLVGIIRIALATPQGTEFANQPIRTQQALDAKFKWAETPPVAFGIMPDELFQDYKNKINPDPITFNPPDGKRLVLANVDQRPIHAVAHAVASIIDYSAYGVYVSAYAWHWKQEELEAIVEHEVLHLEFIKGTSSTIPQETLTTHRALAEEVKRQIGQRLKKPPNSKEVQQVAGPVIADFQHAFIDLHDLMNPKFSYQSLVDTDIHDVAPQFVTHYNSVRQLSEGGVPVRSGNDEFKITLTGQLRESVGSYVDALYRSAVEAFPEIEEREEFKQGFQLMRRKQN